MSKTKKFKRVPIEVPLSDLSPLNISCTTTKCEDGLHCFKTGLKEFQKFGEHGVCRECGVSLIDWSEIHQNKIRSARLVFDAMKNELIRHIYWHIEIKEDDLTKAFKKGKIKIQEEVKNRIKKAIGVSEPFRGGFTPYYGNIIYYAQHATATCCRECMNYWHGFEVGRALTEEEIKYSSELIMLYIDERIPDLQNEKA